LLAAILLHDIGHGPFSHSLEHTLVEGVSHEVISSLLMDKLNKEFSGKLDLALTIFKDQYQRKFFHQLVSSQLDIDRMDYLNRDSFFTGVSEGVISFDRIITMLNVQDGELVIDAKGIYSVEKFLIARRLMYWQVYLHKTVLGAEQLLIKILYRAKELSAQGASLFATQALQHFLSHKIDIETFLQDSVHLEWFTKLDDTDIMSALKEWMSQEDKILSALCRKVMNRDLPRTVLRKTPFTDQEVQLVKQHVKDYFELDDDQVDYFVYTQVIANSAYDIEHDSIKILNKLGKVQDITEASDLSNLEALAKPVQKYVISYPKEVGFLLYEG
ncbi:MAG: HD domain-containing protein, partial [Sphingobacterium sp.]